VRLTVHAHKEQIHMHLTLHSALIAALAGLALAATPALARPIDHPAPYYGPTSSLAGTSQPRQDLRGEHARDAARLAEQPAPRVVTEGPTAAAKAIPRAANPVPVSADTDSEPWLVLGIGLGTAGLAGVGAAAMSRRTRVRATA
jgi:hypothetical protein